MVKHIGLVDGYFGWLNHLHYELLSKREKNALIAGFLANAADNGCICILEWNKNYYDKMALWRNKFIPYPKVLRLIAWKFNTNIPMVNLDAFYEQHI